MTNRLQGKVALVTGGASGVGLEVVKLLLGEGAKVAFSDINETAGQQLAAELGDGSMFVRHDVSSETDWTLVMAAVQQRLGRLDVLVNNAGILLFKSILQTSKQEYERVIDVNLVGSFLGVKFVGEHMIGN